MNTRQTKPRDTGPSRGFEIFISYSRKDNEPKKPAERGWVTALRDKIIEDHRQFSTEPLNIFFDTSDIVNMDDWRHRISVALRNSRTLLVCLSPNYFASRNCKEEFDEYVRKQARRTGQDTLAPIYFTEVPNTSEQEIAKDWYELLRRPNRTDLRPWFPLGTEALRETAVRQMLEQLGTSLWERLKRARQRDAVPGNLRLPNPYFVGRDAELRQIHESLPLGRKGNVTVVYGLGGQGKTELATAYADCYAHYYPGGLWTLASEGKKDILSLIAELSEPLQISSSEANDETVEQRANRVLTELERLACKAADEEHEAACLLLLDNVSEPELLAEPQLIRLRKEDWLRVLVTTRLGPDSVTGASIQFLSFVAVDALRESDAAGLLKEHQQDGCWPSATAAADAAAALEVVRDLGGFTLAVEGIAIYLGLNPEIRPTDYLARLRAEGLPSVDALTADADVGRQMLHREKQLSIVLAQTLSGLSRVERAALEYAARLSPDAVPWPWLRELVEEEQPGSTKAALGYPDPWSKVRRRLEGLRFLTPGDHPEVARMHRMVTAIVNKDLGAEDGNSKRLRLDAFLNRLCTSFDDEVLRFPRVRWQLTPLEQTILHLKDTGANLPLAEDALVLGRTEANIGRIDRAFTFLELSLKIGEAECAIAPESIKAKRFVATALGALGNCLLRTGQFEQAFSAFERSRNTREDLLATDRDNPDAKREVALSYLWLGDFFLNRQHTGDADKAVPPYDRSLKMTEEALAITPNNEEIKRDIARLLQRKGTLLRMDGRVAEALKCYQRSLGRLEEVSAANPQDFRVKHDFAVMLFLIGNVLLERGEKNDISRAPEYQRRALKIHEELFDADPDDSRAKRNLSESLHQIADFLTQRAEPGDAEQALAYYQRSLNIDEELSQAAPRNLRIKHNLSVSLANMGNLLTRRADQGDAEQALAYYQRGLNINEELSQAAPRNRRIKRSLSVSLGHMGNLLTQRADPGDAEQALAYYHRSLNIDEELSQAAPRNLQAKRDLSMSLGDMGNLLTRRADPGDAEQALDYYRRLRQLRTDLEC